MQDGKDIWFMGGGQLAAPLLAAGLIDVIEVAIMPAVIGNGIKMIAASAKAGYALHLTGVTRLETSGILLARYAVCYDT
jgi:dihydrofolate reductase